MVRWLTPSQCTGGISPCLSTDNEVCLCSRPFFRDEELTQHHHEGRPFGRELMLIYPQPGELQRIWFLQIA